MKRANLGNVCRLRFAAVAAGSASIGREVQRQILKPGLKPLKNLSPKRLGEIVGAYLV